MSVIYKIYCKDENIKDCYIGSTNNLTKRKRQHKYTYDNINIKNCNLKLYTFIRANGGFENFDFIILEQFNTIIDKQDLFKIEGQYIKNNNSTLNCRLAGRTVKEYYQDNKQKLLEDSKKYYEDNKSEILEKVNNYRKDNKTEIIERKKKYYEQNKEQINEKRKVKYEKNKEQLVEKRKQYYEENKEKISEKGKVKVICEFCKSLINKSQLKRHQRTKKCIECKNNIL